MSLAAELILSGNEADKLAPRAAIAILGNIPNADAATCLLFLGSSCASIIGCRISLMTSSTVNLMRMAASLAISANVGHASDMCGEA